MVDGSCKFFKFAVMPFGLSVGSFYHYKDPKSPDEALEKAGNSFIYLL